MLKNWLIISGAIGIAFTSANIRAQNKRYLLKGKVGEYSAPAKAYLIYSSFLHQ